MVGAGSEESYKNGNQQILYAVHVALWLLDLITFTQSVFFFSTTKYINSSMEIV